MGIKKIIKYSLLGVIGLLIGKIVFQELFDNRPFRFEKYKTSEQLEEAAKLKFPVGADLDNIRNDLERSGAECYTYKPSGRPINHVIVLYCKYTTSLLSLHPLERYRVWLEGDSDYKLIEIGAQRISGLMLYIP